MIAFHGKEEIKKEYLDRVIAHRKADQIIKGKYWENGKGCAVGCTVHSANHNDYETALGIPSVLASLEDGIFEALPNKLALEWPQKFLEAIKPGADLSKVWPKFAIWLLTDHTHGVLRLAKTERSKEVIQHVSDLYLMSLKEEVPIKKWRAAAYAAYDAHADARAADAHADGYAAYAAYDAAAAYAAYVDSDGYAAYVDSDGAYDAAAHAAAAYAADAHADAAYDVVADARARATARIAQSIKLLELLAEAK